MYVIIQFCYSKSAGVKSDQIDFVFFIHNRKNCSESIVPSISFHNELSIRNLVYENGSRDEYLLKGVKSITTEEIELQENILPDKIYQ